MVRCARRGGRRCSAEDGGGGSAVERRTFRASVGAHHTGDELKEKPRNCLCMLVTMWTYTHNTLSETTTTTNPPPLFSPSSRAHHTHTRHG